MKHCEKGTSVFDEDTVRMLFLLLKNNCKKTWNELKVESHVPDQ